MSWAVRDEAKRTQRPIAWIVREMLDESWRARRFPGIVFVEGRFGRRAEVAGTGLDVWRIVELLVQYGNAAAVCEHVPLISQGQIRLAQTYARSFPGEIDFFREVEELKSQTGAREWEHLGLSS
jgi:uncharacterized protein (DUF433 family)